MRNADRLSAKHDDLLLTIIRHGTSWRVRVEEIDDPDSAYSGGIDYPSAERAKRETVLMARELFGTGVPEKDLEWRPSPGSTGDQQ